MVGADGTYSASTPISRFKNSSIDLTLPLIDFSQPATAHVKKYGDTPFTLWDCLELAGPKKFGELIEWIEAQTGTTVTMLSYGNSPLYAAFFKPQKRAELSRLSVEDVVAQVTGQKEHRQAIVFKVMAQNDDEEDIEVPYIKYLTVKIARGAKRVHDGKSLTECQDSKAKRKCDSKDVVIQEN